MNRKPASNIHSRARRSPTLPLRSPTADDYRDDPRSKAKSSPTKKSLLRVFVKCGLLSLLVQFLLLRVSFVLDTEDVASRGTIAVPMEVDEVVVPTIARRTPRRPDGTFNGYPVYYRNVTELSTYAKPHTLQNCLGENFQPDSWMRRSCHFQFFCFNMTSRNFQVYQRLDDQDILPWSQQVPFLDVSATLLSDGTTTRKAGVSLGGINLKWGKSGVRRLQWFPQVFSTPPMEFYALPPDVVMIPFYSLGGWNPGHAVWDDFLPMYTLTQLFQLPSRSILAIRYHLDDGEEGLWASCEDPQRLDDCWQLQNKFWPLFNNQSFPTTQQSIALDVAPNPRKTDLVCAKNGLAGIGDLTDHGTQKFHGWHDEDYHITHNHGRGGMFWKFRNFCLENLGLSNTGSSLSRQQNQQQQPYRIVISMQSSDNKERSLDFAQQEAFLSSKLKGYHVSVTTAVFKEMTVLEQVRVATETNVFITGCGGGAVTATFLPKGATAIIYYHEHGGQKHNKATNLPARLDWDLFNHLSYLQVHWFPIQTMNNPLDLNLLATVVRDALDRQILDHHKL